MGIKGIAALAACIALLAGAAPAQADFHGLCSPTGTTSSTLGESGGTFTFTGTVRCGGATRIEISSIALLAGDGSEVARGTPASCGPCDAVTASGTAPAAPGTYAVRYVFSVATPTGSATNKVRTFVFDYNGAGQPVPRSGTATYADGCSPRGTDEVGFSADGFAGTFSGEVTCVGAESVAIRSLTLERLALGAPLEPRSTVVGRASAASCTSCTETVRTSGTVTGPQRPGRYRVTMVFDVVDALGRTFSGVTHADTWLWAGAGPAFAAQ